MATFAFGFVVGGGIGFVIGALVFRNNPRRGEEAVQKAKKVFDIDQKD